MVEWWNGIVECVPWGERSLLMQFSIDPLRRCYSTIQSAATISSQSEVFEVNAFFRMRKSDDLEDSHSKNGSASMPEWGLKTQ